MHMAENLKTTGNDYFDIFKDGQIVTHDWNYSMEN